MLLQHMTWGAVEAYLKERGDILVPMGSTEQHGPNGPIGTDAICAEAVARRVGEQAQVIVAPTIAYGQAQFNLAFPGTISATARTLMSLLRDIIVSVAEQGFRHVYFVNGHGGNIAPAEAAIQDAYHEQRGGSPARCRLRSWWDFPEVSAIRDRLYGDREGLHATPSEISITQAVLAAAAPELGERPEITPASPDLLGDHARDRHYDQAAHRQAFPDGRVGSDPWLATREAGEKLIEAAAGAIAADLANFVAGAS
jgi:creatinine amidohydrolase